MSASLLRTEHVGRVAVLHLDDGKANALSPAMITALRAALDAAAADADAVVLAGRPGRFSGGFDLGVMREGIDAARALVTAGAELAVQAYGYPKPLVAACTGHALAMGAFLLLACDLRIGAAGDFKIGLNETAIGMTVPAFGVALAGDRIASARTGRARSCSPRCTRPRPRSRPASSIAWSCRMR